MPSQSPAQSQPTKAFALVYIKHSPGTSPFDHYSNSTQLASLSICQSLSLSILHIIQIVMLIQALNSVRDVSVSCTHQFTHPSSSLDSVPASADLLTFPSHTFSVSMFPGAPMPHSPLISISSPHSVQPQLAAALDAVRRAHLREDLPRSVRGGESISGEYCNYNRPAETTVSK